MQKLNRTNESPGGKNKAPAATGKKRDLSRDVVNVFAADITTTNIEYVSLFSLKKKNHDQTRRQLGLSLKEAKENWSSAPSGCTA